VSEDKEDVPAAAVATTRAARAANQNTICDEGQMGDELVSVSSDHLHKTQSDQDGIVAGNMPWQA
jgi:hypothetical protein